MSSAVLKSAGDTRICVPFSRTLTRAPARSSTARVAAGSAWLSNATMADRLPAGVRYEPHLTLQGLAIAMWAMSTEEPSSTSPTSVKE